MRVPALLLHRLLACRVPSRRDARTLLLIGMIAAIPATAQQPFGEKEAQAAVKTSCLACHRGKAAAARLDLTLFASGKPMDGQPRKWLRVLTRVRNGDMPPQNAPALEANVREGLVNWLDHTLRSAACADGIAPGPALMRRLNRNEYSATARDLLNIPINAAHALPADGAGGEGFDNAAETLFLSPMHAEKYLEAAKLAIEYALHDPRSRARFMNAEPKGDVTAEQAARKILDAFVVRAFRRPAGPGEVDKYFALFQSAMKRTGATFDDSIQFALEGVLMSPHFLFRLEEPNPGPDPRPVSHYDMASRLSYFLWGSMPDDVLLDLAAQGKLQDPAILKEQVVRMLRAEKSREFAEHFVEQWLNTRELGRDIKPDEKLFPEYYDAEITAAIRYEPILFFQEVLSSNLPLTTLLDSKWTILNNKLARHYKLDMKGLKQQPARFDVPENSHRGGLLTMAAVLAVSSYPQRTSPVLRGKWILDAILGTPPPPPPPNVPELKDAHAGAAPQTVRERLELHRQNPACASCHNRIDPLGFGLENYEVLGRWRTEDSGKPVDAKGVLPDGTEFDGVDGLRKILLERKDVFVKNLTTKLLGYALGRGLTLEDYCAVDQIVDQVKASGYSAHTLIHEIVLSVPFRFQPGTTPGKSVSQELQRPAAVAANRTKE
jgi:mono/diheme cytochrome c family protein